MRTKIDFIADRVEGSLEQAGTDVGLAWNEWPAGSVADPVTGVMSGKPTARTETIKAFVHFVQPASALVRNFNEIETGDCIIDYASGVTLEGRTDLRFTIGSNLGGAPVEWSAKPLSELLAETWDAMFANRRLFKTLLLKRSTG